MLALIDCRRWLISTNGDNFAHPDDAAIAKVITTAAGPVTFFCNYRTVRTMPWEEHGPVSAPRSSFRRPTSTRSASRFDNGSQRRSEVTLRRVSNQNGAPSEMATAPRRLPNKYCHHPCVPQSR